MAAGLGFKDFVTGEVLTAADVDGYLMQGVWVFASAAARDAAVTAPQEGNFAYLKDTNVTTYYTGSAWALLDTTGMSNPMTTTGDTIYLSSGSTPARLGIGSTGQVLTVSGGVPSWSTPAAGGGAYTSLASGSLSGSSVSLTSISGSYTDLYLVVNDVNLNTDSYLGYRLNNDTTANFHISNYLTSRIGGGLATAANSGTYLDSTFYDIDSGDNNNSACLRINDYTNLQRKNGIVQISYQTDNGQNGVLSNLWAYTGTGSISRIDIITGSTFNGGTYILYGVK